MAPAQVDLGGASHALQFLEQLSPHVHVFTHAALFRNAVWLPYRCGWERVLWRSCCHCCCALWPTHGLRLSAPLRDPLHPMLMVT